MMLEPTLGYKSVWRVLGIMSETPNRAYMRPELLEYTKLGNAPLTRALKILTTTGIVFKTVEGKKKEKYTLNHTSQLASELIKLEQAEIADFGHIDYHIKIEINEFIRKAIDKAKSIQKIILFGSLARGTGMSTSDIDLAIITSKHDPRQEKIIDRIADQTSKKHEREIQTHHYTIKELQDKKDNLARQIKKEGKDLLGPSTILHSSFHDPQVIYT